MPRPKSPAVTYHALIASLGPPERERAQFVPVEPNGTLRPPRKIHRGWSWRCGCTAFARDDGDAYLYVPCVGHTVARNAISRRAIGLEQIA